MPSAMTTQMSGKALSLFFTACMLTVTAKRVLFLDGSTGKTLRDTDSGAARLAKRQTVASRAGARENLHRNPRAAPESNKIMRFS